jgi:hypothetical protein
VTTGHDRDQVVEELLKRSLRSGSAAASEDDCPDAEMLAAWFDGGLDDRKRMAVMSHAAACARCQESLAVLARTAPVEASAPPWWRRQWKTWLVPVTAAAAAATLWMVVPGQRDTRPAAGVAPDSLSQTAQDSP